MRGMTRALACATAATVVAAGMIAAPAAQAADAIVVWADPVHAPVIQQLTANGSDDIMPAWSPTDPNVIYFLSNRGGAYNLWRLRLK